MQKVVAALFSFFLCTFANAVTVEWTLHNFVFDDGGTASGSFELVFDYPADDVSNFHKGITVQNVNILTTAGSIMAEDYAYDTWWVRGTSCGTECGVTHVNFGNSSGQRMVYPFLNIGFGSPGTGGSLQPDGGTISFVPGRYGDTSGQGIASNLGVPGESDYLRYIVSGYVTGEIIASVPIPAAGWLFSFALLSFSAIRRMK